MNATRTRPSPLARSILVVIASIVISVGLPLPAEASPTQMSIARYPDDSTPGTDWIAEYFWFHNHDQDTALRCIIVQWGSEPDGTGVIPGFVVSEWATVSASNGLSLTGGSTTVTAQSIRRTFNADSPEWADFEVTVDGTANGTVPNETYYAVVTTYSNVGCTNAVNYAVTAFQYTDATTVTVEVQPTMSFTVSPRATECSQQSVVVNDSFNNSGSASLIDLGRTNVGTVAQAAQDLSTTTNAANGVTVNVRGDYAGTPGNYNLRNTVTPSSNPIPDVGGTTPVAGTSQFSYTVSNHPTGGQELVWHGLTNTNAPVAFSTTGGFTPQCIGFSVAASGTVPAGSYQAVIHYTAVPSF